MFTCLFSLYFIQFYRPMSPHKPIIKKPASILLRGRGFAVEQTLRPVTTQGQVTYNLSASVPTFVKQGYYGNYH